MARVVEWLTWPEEIRPRLITLYFEHVDTAGHDFGRGSPELARAVAEVDANIGRLLDAIADQGLAGEVNSGRRSGLTFAPEAGTWRLRRVINKNFSNQQMIAAAVVPEDGDLQVYSGTRMMTIRWDDSDPYYGERALRGGMLPRGWRKVDRLVGVARGE